MDSDLGASSGAVQLRRELACLRLLTHLGCATLPQLQTACFPQAALSTVRYQLRRLCDAGWLTHSPWYLPRTNHERGQVWTITLRGRAFLNQYDPAPPFTGPLDLGCPTTALERDEWRIRLAVRTFVIQLIHAARQHPFLAHLHVAAPLSWPTPLVGVGPVVLEALLRIAWEPAVQQDAYWLPWPAAPDVAATTVTYRVFVDRGGPLDALVTRAERGAARATDVLLLIADTPERLHALCALVHGATRRTPVRLTCWAALAERTCMDGWFDAYGQHGGLPLRTHEVIGAWHAATLA